ncbi:hypothetical protein [Neorhizobium sp. NCHU2750]|uniref:hypothetical protein n=1 Tax=Neorhizobium sp. NCHU2750 TaxID=1825976 RepID=UPI000E716B31|nr:hypothetical protein NCHU2750_28030 [Neorhizobium sp. NCHU2750]
MPRSSGVYSEPAGTKGTPNTTIQSAPYNAFVDDLVADANAARPITAGGTGATNATAAREALGLKIGTNIQAYDALLQAMSGLVTANNQLIYTTGADTVALTTLSAYGRSLIDDADAAAARATLGLGNVSTLNGINDGNWSGADLSVANGGTGASTAAAARTNLGLAAIASSGSASDLSTGFVANGRLKHLYSSDADDGLAYLVNTGDGTSGGKLGLSTAGTLLYSYDNVERFRVNVDGTLVASIGAGNIDSGTIDSARLPTVPIAKGGTAATTASAARTNLGLGGLATMDLTDLFYTGSSIAGGVPVGAYIGLLASSARGPRNSTVSVYYDGSNNDRYTYSASGNTPVTGTFVYRAALTSDSSLVQRRA